MAQASSTSKKTESKDKDEAEVQQVGPGESYIKDGPTQDDLNPAYAPPPEDVGPNRDLPDSGDAKGKDDDDDKSKSGSSK